MNMREISRLGLVLTLYASVACVLLAATYSLTKDAADRQDKARKAEALKELFPDMDSSREIEAAAIGPLGPGAQVEYAVEIRQKEVVRGLALAVSFKSYGGRAQALVGLGLDNRLSGIKFLELNDTPGLGQNAQDPRYYVDKKAKLTWFGQFAGKSVDDPFAVRNDITAITASTITSRAVSQAVKAAARAGAAYLAKAAQGGPQ